MYNPFKLDLKWWPKCKIWLKCLFAIELSTTKNWNIPWGALMCPLQIINWHWTPIMDPSWCKHMPIHHPSNVENYSISHKSETAQPKKKKVVLENIFLHLSANFWLKIHNTHGYRNGGTILTSGQSALNGPANGSEVTYSKIQNRLSRAP